ncbi:thymidylate synthase-like protein [sediment metagenome]|uniref:Thymidylate synthase-like protein n=1 Tax=sediment metagenome TaxID=749907 RepID=D9PKL0_9ZZZZ
MPLQPHSVIVASDAQVSCDVADEVVILHLGESAYFGLDNVGAAVWRLLQTPKRFDEVVEAVMREFDVEHETCVRDLDALLADLAAKGLVRITTIENSG